ncbi:MAG: response regulator transcription factor, partial [Clostridia bacterium]|nr:response regulator transcription factor [Clostridia bacterium]
MSSYKVLIVDDESRMRKLIKDFLSLKEYTVIEAEDGQKALDLFNMHNDINLIILDVMMPVLDGWATLREIRKTSNIPIIMLTARGEERDELFGFELGVDEYISKPFSPKILVARVEALLKRCFPESNDIKEFDGIKIDKVAHQVSVDGKEIDMSMKEFELLVFLTDNI